MSIIAKNLKIYLLKWLNQRKDNILISKSMLPKLNDFNSFSDVDIWSSLDSLYGKNFVTFKQLGGGERPIQLIAISEQGELFLQENEME